jgi:hypothetical protein
MSGFAAYTTEGIVLRRGGPSVTGSTLALRGFMEVAADSRSRRSYPQLPICGVGGLPRNRPTLHSLSETGALRRRRSLGVASSLQKVVEVAVLHALQERADLSPAKDQRGPLRIPGVPYRDLMTWQHSRLDAVTLGTAAPTLPPTGRS